MLDLRAGPVAYIGKTIRLWSVAGTRKMTEITYNNGTTGTSGRRRVRLHVNDFLVLF